MLATAEWLDYIWAIVGVAISCLAPPGIAILVNWLKKVKFVKNLHLEALIDKLAELALHYAESLGRKLGKKGLEKLELAKEALRKELLKYNIDIGDDLIEQRLEFLFNKLKDEIEAATKKK